jgi:glyoxylase-like metal-dependent hydrolase (beta-lactamase superfamily II)
MSARDDKYEVYALRYSARGASKAHEFFRYELYGGPDEPLGMDYFFWLLRNDGRTVLVDCGFDRERAAAKNRFQDTDPLELLARLDVRPGEVDHVIISHMHYDHVGNVELFPSATFSIAREEYDYWSGPYGGRDLMRILVDPEEVRIVQDLARQERLHLIDGSEQLFPGVIVTRLGGHTPGQAMIEVSTDSGQLILASDAMHYYEEIELDRPYNLFNDLSDMYRAYDILRELNRRPDTTVVAGHDPCVRTMFQTVQPDCVDLTALAEGIPPAGRGQARVTQRGRS